MLNLGQTFRCLHHALQAVIVKLVGSSASSASAKSRAHRDRVVVVRDVLMNDVIGKAGQRRFAAIDENFDLVGRRVLLDSIEDITGFISCQHSEFFDGVPDTVQFPLYAVPTLMLRNLAGAAPCPVPITCCGWPLPQ